MLGMGSNNKTAYSAKGKVQIFLQIYALAGKLNWLPIKTFWKSLARK